MLRLLCLAHDLTCQDIDPWDLTETPSKTVEASDTWSTISCQTEMSCCFVRCPWEENLLYLLILCDTTYISSLEFYLQLHIHIINIYKDKICIIIPSKYPCITRSYDRPFEAALRWLSHIYMVKTYHFRWRWLCYELTPQNQATGQYNTTGTRKLVQRIPNVSPIPMWMIRSLIMSHYERSWTFTT